jgi:hypothetical protein
MSLKIIKNICHFLYHLSLSITSLFQFRDRQASLIESFVDFQRQMQFKRVVLNRVAERASEERRGARRQLPSRRNQEPTVARGRGRPTRLDRTPSNAARRHSAYNPLDSDRVRLFVVGLGDL